mmetsp:Transcript_18519/g.19290  ORF Transcript_18519/g.19290 Transcript_18519/m.19290 type:complete len:87 (+) Transcript_18519:48-308(+)|eukprot:CAMPEP_0174818898 /NCGR_PEP_ID=MMETSP1107-20130205/1840_1 /TAXON_ID=36770 /ORGANISM="Paraphysomonas vestita, Strain GFlagA" /LENGTH=86 /DNA_ID=CAMNT_0016031473 /DNA_START=39 /DNA_END=299 /DNA_ORIENTATION=-
MPPKKAAAAPKEAKEAKETKETKEVKEVKKSPKKAATKDKNGDGRITRSEGTEDAVGDLNSDGRVTRSEARAARQAGFDVNYQSLK